MLVSLCGAVREFMPCRLVPFVRTVSCAQLTHGPAR